MISTIALMLSHPRRAVMVVLGLGAVAGCSILAASGQSAAKIERPVPEQVTSLQAHQTQLLTGRDQPQTTAPDITQPRQQPGFAQDEMARLAQDRTQILPRSPAARPPLASASSAVRQPQNRVSQAGSVARPPAHPPQAPARPARTVLKKPGPRLLVAEAGK
jgi:outer membrane murein-binding lipoprotein Lpp